MAPHTIFAMPFIKYYTTVAGQDVRELDRTVNEKIEEGWQPHGGPYVSNLYGDSLCYQAMVMSEEEATKRGKPEFLDPTNLGSN